MHAEMLILQFSREVVDQPLIYRLVKDFNLEFNMLKAAINPQQEGVLVMELRGHPQDFRRGLKFLKDAGVKVKRMATPAGIVACRTIVTQARRTGESPCLCKV